MVRICPIYVRICLLAVDLDPGEPGEDGEPGEEDDGAGQHGPGEPPGEGVEDAEGDGRLARVGRHRVPVVDD